jgi:DNA-binding transcriptional MerR regulator
MTLDGLKIGQLAEASGLTVKTIRYYELHGLLDRPRRTPSGYRLYGQEDVERLEFIKKAKRLGLSLEEVREIFVLHRRGEAPCIHVLGLLDQKLEYLDRLVRELLAFREDLARLREESQARLAQLPAEARVCGIIEHSAGTGSEAALAWIERRSRGRA